MFIPPRDRRCDGEGRHPIADVCPRAMERPTNCAQGVERHDDVVKQPWVCEQGFDHKSLTTDDTDGTDRRRSAFLNPWDSCNSWSLCAFQRRSDGGETSIAGGDWPRGTVGKNIATWRSLTCSCLKAPVRTVLTPGIPRRPAAIFFRSAASSQRTSKACCGFIRFLEDYRLDTGSP